TATGCLRMRPPSWAVRVCVRGWAHRPPGSVSQLTKHPTAASVGQPATDPTQGSRTRPEPAGCPVTRRPAGRAAVAGGPGTPVARRWVGNSSENDGYADTHAQVAKNAATVNAARTAACEPVVAAAAQPSMAAAAAV